MNKYQLMINWHLIAFILFIAIEVIQCQGPVINALFLGEPNYFNTSREDCVWRHGNDYDSCPDPEVTMTLYSPKTKAFVDVRQNDWLRNSLWDPEKDNIILIHGYGGSDDSLPITVLRDAYISHGGYNVFMVNWGSLCTPPCYVAAVHNTKPVARCLAQAFTFLRKSGLRVDKTTCVGHSLGAHICGLMSNYLNFRIERIIGLDPARPLIRPGAVNRLDSGDAKAVQVIHTNAGYYGEGGRVGHVDFCVNGGRKQPYCSSTSNVNLCSHIWAICYLAQSIFDMEPIDAKPCNRRCLLTPRRLRNDYRGIGNSIPMGHHTPLDAVGSFCVKDSSPPFCPRQPGGVGDIRCCIKPAADNAPPGEQIGTTNF